MRGSLKYWLLLVLCFLLAAILSYVAFYGFWVGVRLFHTVSAARACDAAGSVVLFPARLVFYCYGGLLDQSSPYTDPMNYVLINAVLLGLLLYACFRPVIFRVKKTEK
jgi:hypothetical protein